MDESDDSKETTSPTPDTDQADEEPEAQEKKEEKKDDDSVTSSSDVKLDVPVSSTAIEPLATETSTETPTETPVETPTETPAETTTDTTPETATESAVETQTDTDQDTSPSLTPEPEQTESTKTSPSIGEDGFLELDPETERRMREIEEAEAQKAAEVEEEEEPQEVGIFAVKTSIGHEKMVANWLAMRVRKRKLEVYAILSPPKLRGYLLLEGIKNKEALQDMIKGVQHARSVVDGASSLEEIEHFLTPKPLVSGIEEGDVVEIIAGPFKGEKAKVTQIDESKEEITVELFEAMVSIPVTIRGDHVRILEKENK